MKENILENISISSDLINKIDKYLDEDSYADFLLLKSYLIYLNLINRKVICLNLNLNELIKDLIVVWMIYFMGEWLF